MGTSIITYVAIYFIAINIITFLVYGIDKWKAKRNHWRISEYTLLMLALIGGVIGAWIGMKIFHHKTKHKKFKFGIPAILFIWIAGVVLLVCSSCGTTQNGTKVTDGMYIQVSGGASMLH